MRAKSVQWVRAVAFAAVRGVAVVLGCVGIWMLFSELLGQVVSAVVPSMYKNGQPTGFPNWLHAFLYSAAFRHGVTLLVIAGLLVVLSGWISRFVFRPPVHACPRCEHALAGDEAVCPECGQGGLAG